ncbi:MAG: hypothetical protein KDD37_10345, partial [Bdellovibrionales bacterium]|nr:hypothetical protein [Bdellovibrionales bacterium]
ALLFPYAFFLASNSKIVQIGVYTVLLAMGIRSIKLNYVDYANPKEAYVYVQTSPKMKEVVDPLRKWIKLHPDEKNLRFLIQTKSEWPLPWLLKDFKAAVYVNVLPDNWKTYDIVIMDRPLFDVVAKPFEDNFFKKDFQIRFEQEPSVLLITNERKDIISIYGGSF